MKVFLNPGHAPNGHPDPGAVNEETGLCESDVALAVGKSAASYLNAAGVETELLQSDSLYEICETANSSDADIFVSIHCMPLKPKKPTAQKPGPAPAVIVAVCWRAASRASWSMLSVPLTGA